MGMMQDDKADMQQSAMSTMSTMRQQRERAVGVAGVAGGAAHGEGRRARWRETAKRGWSRNASPCLFVCGWEHKMEAQPRCSHFSLHRTLFLHSHSHSILAFITPSRLDSSAHSTRSLSRSPSPSWHTLHTWSTVAPLSGPHQRLV